MTSNQIAYYKAKTEAKHYRRSDKEQKRHNEAGEALTNYANVSTNAHYERQDAINKSHYERADNASLIQAQAASSQAATAAGNLQLQREIEYPSGAWSPDGEKWYITDDVVLANGNVSVPKGYNSIPVSAQIKLGTVRKDWYAGTEQKEKAESYTATEFANYGKGVTGFTSGILNLLNAGRLINNLKSVEVVGSSIQ